MQSTRARAGGTFSAQCRRKVPVSLPLVPLQSQPGKQPGGAEVGAVHTLVAVERVTPPAAATPDAITTPPKYAHGPGKWRRVDL